VELELQEQVAFNWQVSSCAGVELYSCVVWKPCGAESFPSWAALNAQFLQSEHKLCIKMSLIKFTLILGTVLLSAIPPYFKLESRY